MEAATELGSNYTGFALPITRLTSIKSMCREDVNPAEKFALYLSKLVLQQASIAVRSDNITPDEWEIHKTLMSDAVIGMENFLESPTSENTKSLWSLSKLSCELQGDDYRNIHWTNVHFVKSGYLLKFNYAIFCFIKPSFDYYGYRLAREYTECYARSLWDWFNSQIGSYAIGSC